VPQQVEVVDLVAVAVAIAADARAGLDLEMEVEAALASAVLRPQPQLHHGLRDGGAVFEARLVDDLETAHCCCCGTRPPPSPAGPTDLRTPSATTWSARSRNLPRRTKSRASSWLMASSRRASTRCTVICTSIRYPCRSLSQPSSWSRQWSALTAS